MATLKFGSVAPKCKVCTKSVYENEKIEYDGMIWHDTCFKCQQCKSIVIVKNVAMISGDLYCKTCFKKIFTKEGKYSSFATLKSGDTNAPTASTTAATATATATITATASTTAITKPAAPIPTPTPTRPPAQSTVTSSSTPSSSSTTTTTTRPTSSTVSVASAASSSSTTAAVRSPVSSSPSASTSASKPTPSASTTATIAPTTNATVSASTTSLSSTTDSSFVLPTATRSSAASISVQQNSEYIRQISELTSESSSLRVQLAAAVRERDNAQFVARDMVLKLDASEQARAKAVEQQASDKKQHADTMASLIRQRDIAIGEIQDAVRGKISADERSNQLQSELKSAQAQIEAQTQALAQAQEHARIAAAASSSTTSSASTMIADYESRLSLLSAERDAAVKKASFLERESVNAVQALSAELKTAKSELEEVTAKLKLAEEAAENDVEKENLTQELNDVKTERDDLKEQLEMQKLSSSSAISTLDSEVASLKASLASLSSERDISVGEIGTLRFRISTLEHSVQLKDDMLTQSALTYDSRIADLENKVNELTEQRDDAISELFEAVKERETNAANIRRMTVAQKEVMSMSLSPQLNVRGVAKTSSSSSSAAAKTVREEEDETSAADALALQQQQQALLQQQAERISALESEIASLQNRLLSALSERESLNERVASLSAQLSSDVRAQESANELAGLRLELSEAQAKSVSVQTRYEGQLRELEAEARALGAQLEKERVERGVVERKNAQMVIEMENAQQARKEVETELTRTRQSIALSVSVSRSSEGGLPQTPGSSAVSPSSNNSSSSSSTLAELSLSSPTSASSSSSSSSELGFDPRRANDYTMFLSMGSVLQKHTKKGKPVEYAVFVSAQGILFWADPKKPRPEAGQSISLRSIVRVTFDRGSLEVWRRREAVNSKTLREGGGGDNLIFNLFTAKGEDGAVHFEAKSKEQRDEWVSALKFFFHKHGITTSNQ